MGRVHLSTKNAHASDNKIGAIMLAVAPRYNVHWHSAAGHPHILLDLMPTLDGAKRK